MVSPLDEQIADLFPEPQAAGPLPTIVVWDQGDLGIGLAAKFRGKTGWVVAVAGRRWILPWAELLDRIAKTGDDPSRALESLRVVTATAFLRAPAENIPIEFEELP